MGLQKYCETSLTTSFSIAIPSWAKLVGSHMKIKRIVKQAAYGVTLERRETETVLLPVWNTFFAGIQLLAIGSLVYF